MIYAAVATTPTNAYMNLTIFGSFSEKEIRDVTAKRSATNGVSSIVGFGLAMLLLAFLPPQTKFLYIYLLGVLIGLICTGIVGSMNLSHLEEMKFEPGIQQPEKLFSTSSYFVMILAGGTLLSMVWVPYLMDSLGGPDYLAVAMNLVTTLTSVVASLVYKQWSFGNLRWSVGLDAATPLFALATPIPLIHPILSAYSSFAYTGSNFVGSFLFAKYNQWLGAIKSSLLTIVVIGVTQLAVAPVSIIARGAYTPVFLAIFGIKIAAFFLASTTIPESAIVPPQTARAYSFLLHEKSATGFRISVEFSRDTILMTLRLIGLSLVLAMMYIVYRVLFLMVGWG